MVFISRAIEGIGGGSLGVTQAYIGRCHRARKTRAGLRTARRNLRRRVSSSARRWAGALVRFGYSVPFFVAAAISLVTILLTVTMLPESHTPLPTQPPLRETLRAVFASKLRSLLLIQLCFTLAYTMWVSILALYLERTGTTSVRVRRVYSMRHPA